MVLSIFKDVPLRARRVLLLYNGYGARSIFKMFHWEPEGCFCCTMYMVLDQYSKVFHWEPEEHYCCTMSIVLSIFKDVPLRARRVLLLYNVYGAINIQRCYIENQKGAIAVQCLWCYQYSMMLHWEPEGHYCCTMSMVLDQYSKMFHWEPEGHYCCTMSMAIVPFWFTTEHPWKAIKPFWLSTDDIKMQQYVFLTKISTSEILNA